MPGGQPDAQRAVSEKRFKKLGATIWSGVKTQLDDGKSIGIQFITDSTGNDPASEYIAEFCDRLHALYPANRVEFALYDNATTFDYLASFLTVKYAGASERKVSFVGTVNSDMYYSATTANTWGAGNDLDVRVKCTTSNWSAAAERVMAAKFQAPGARAWYFYCSGSNIVFSYTTDGTTLVTATMAQSNFTLVNGTVTWLRVVLDVDNGAAGRDVKFYQSTDNGVTWVQKGATVTVATAITLFSDSVTPYELGGRGNGGNGNWVGDLYRVEIRKGIGGEIVCPTLPDLWTPNTSAYDGVFSGVPIIQVWAGAASGWGIGNFITSANTMIPAAGQTIALISTSHNDGNLIDAPYWAKWDQLAAIIKSRCPLAPIAVFNQNPKTAPESAIKIATHATRNRQLEAYAARSGFEFIDVYQAFLDAVAGGTAISALVDSVSGIHPTTAGQILWGATINNRFYID